VLEEKNKAIRLSTAMALGINGTRKSLSAVKNAYSRETDPKVKEVLLETINFLEKKRR
jgi:hypothetical protein